MASNPNESVTLTPEQKKLEENRKNRAAKIPAKAGADEEVKTTPATLGSSLGLPASLSVAGKTYEIAPFRMIDLNKVGVFLSSIPITLSAYAMSWDEKKNDYDLEKAAAILNSVIRRNSNDDRPAYDANYVEFTVGTIYATICAEPEPLTQEEIDAGLQQQRPPIEDIFSLVHLALSRKQPDITREEIEDWLDVPTLLPIIRAIFQVNMGLKKRF